MLLTIDGFDHYAPTTESGTNIANYLTAAGYTVANAANNNLNVSAGQDAGSTCLKMTIIAAANNPPSISKSFVTAADKVVFGFAFRGTGSRQRIARINGAVDLLWDVDTGKLKIATDVGVDVIILNAFWFIEIEIDKVGQTVKVWANDTLQLTSALPAGAIVTTHTLMWGLTGASAAAATIEIDDFYVVDSSGGANVGRVGPSSAVTRAPTTDVTTEWTAVGSAGTHASIAAQLSPASVNAPYLQANIEGRRDRFTSNTVLPNDNQIFGVALVAYSRKGDLDNRSLGLTMLTSGGEDEVPVALTTTFNYRQAIFEKAPGNQDWNQNRVESSQFGIVAR